MTVNPDTTGCRDIAIGAAAIGTGVVSGLIGLAVRVHREQKQRANQEQTDKPTSTRRTKS